MGRDDCKFDFREGLDADKIVYKDTRTKWESAIYYCLLMIFTWGYGFGFLALNFYLYSTYENIMKWIFIGIWGFVVLTIVIKGGIGICAKNSAKKTKQIRLLEDQRKLEEIKKNKNDERQRARLKLHQDNQQNQI